MITETTGLIDLIPENIPESLTERPQWVCWRLERMRDGKLTKIPQTPSTGYPASTTDMLTWATFDEALEAYETSDRRPSRSCDGIGFVFSSGDPYAGVDLDDCRDPQTGEISPWAKKIIADASEGYVEASPSGTGVHIIVEGRVRDGGVRRGPVEMYSRERFFTITGVLL